MRNHDAARLVDENVTLRKGWRALEGDFRTLVNRRMPDALPYSWESAGQAHLCVSDSEPYPPSPEAGERLGHTYLKSGSVL